MATEDTEEDSAEGGTCKGSCEAEWSCPVAWLLFWLWVAALRSPGLCFGLPGSKGRSRGRAAAGRCQTRAAERQKFVKELEG